MATFSKNNFIIPVGVDSSNLRLRDIKGNLKHTIVNNSNSTFYTNGANVIIRTDGDTTDIKLNFGSVAEAIQALSLLNKEYSKIKNNIVTKKHTDLVNVIDTVITEGRNGINIIPKQILFSNAQDNNNTLPIIDNQTEFIITDATSIHSVSINGVIINDYSFDVSIKCLNIEVEYLGYDIDRFDEVLVKYFI
jgi:hypothetical protein